MAHRDPDRERFQARLREWRSFHALAAALAPFFLAFLLFALPKGLGLRSDDFGYVRSILGALERGGIHTYEWLAPFNAVMTGLCALGWRLTGSLPVTAAVYMAATACLAFVLLFRLLAARAAPGWAALLTLAFAMSPSFFNKVSDFHGSVLTLALFLAALGLHEARKPGPFLAAAFLAFANRQSSIVLLLLPLAQAAQDLRQGQLIRARLPAYLALFTVCAWALRLYMNRTVAQNPSEMFAGNGWPDQLRISLLALAAGMGGVIALLSLFGAAGRDPLEILKVNLRRPVLPVCLTAVLLAAACFWPSDLVRTDFPLFGAVGWGLINAVLPWVFIFSLWFLDRRLLRPSPYLALAAAYAAITALRGIWWDYYFLEIAVLCLLIAVGDPEAPASRLPGRFAHAVAAVCVAGGFLYGYLLKVNVDKQALAAHVFERLEREGRVTVDEMSNAPFGFLGWKLFDYYLDDGDRGRGPMIGFQQYVRRDRVMVETQAPWRRAFKSSLGEGMEVLESGRARIGFVELDYRVVDRHGPDSNLTSLGPAIPLDPARYLPRPFPLDSREWNDLAASFERRGPARPGSR